MDFRVLGPLEVSEGDRTLRLGGFRQRPRARLVRMVDVGTIVAVAVLALVMVNAVAVAGLAQRAIALIGITWYAVEAIRTADPSPTARPQLGSAAVSAGESGGP